MFTPKMNPSAKSLSLTFRTDSSITSKELAVQLEATFSKLGKTSVGILSEGADIGKEVIFMVDVTDPRKWKQTLEQAFEFMAIEGNALEDIVRFGQVEFESAQIYGLVSLEEQALFSKLSSFTSETRRVIINALSEITSLRDQVKKYHDEIAGLKVSNTQIAHTNSLMTLLGRMAERLGMEDELTETSFVQLH